MQLSTLLPVIGSSYRPLFNRCGVLQAVPFVFLGTAAWWWAKQSQQGKSSNSTEDLLTALDQEASKTTARYWFGPEAEQQDSSKTSPSSPGRPC